MKESENLEIEHVKKIFQIKDVSFEVLTDIDLKIRAGEFISIVGASGCGKSTLARMIAGLEKPTDGEIKIGGKRVEKPSVHIGMVFQEARLFPWLTVEKNIAFGIHEKLPAEENWSRNISKWSDWKILRRHCPGSCPGACSSGSVSQEH